MTTATHYDAMDLFDQIFNNALRPRAYDKTCKPQAAKASQTPQQEVRLIRLDVVENGGQYLVHAELPGVRKENIQIDIEGKLLVLSANMAQPQAESPAAEANPAEAVATPARRVLLSERFEGRLTRRLQLPEEVDAENAQAKFTDGVLELVLPKLQQRSGRKLHIQ